MGDREFSDELIAAARSILDGLSFSDQCRVVGIHPKDATRGVNAAGPGGVVVPMSRKTGRVVAEGKGRSVGRGVSGSSRDQLQCLTSDEVYARVL